MLRLFSRHPTFAIQIRRELGERSPARRGKQSPTRTATSPRALARTDNTMLRKRCAHEGWRAVTVLPTRCPLAARPHEQRLPA
jgi:hypothetical protein